MGLVGEGRGRCFRRIVCVEIWKLGRASFVGRVGIVCVRVESSGIIRSSFLGLGWVSGMVRVMILEEFLGYM